MHYNQFTIDYINAVKNNLKIEFNLRNNAVFIQDKIHIEDIKNLKKELSKIWENSQSAIDLVESKHDALIQSGLFGLIDDMDLAIKVGFLLGDRVVLIDYLFERLLSKKDLSKINIDHLGVIASYLVNTLKLAEEGRVVIIPNPLKWNKQSKEIIQKIHKETNNMTPELMTLLNMLSITKKCKLHPYTIAESEENYQSIINSQLDRVNVIGKDAANYAYESILGALLTEKLFQEVELKYIQDIPLSVYSKIVLSNKKFYREYLSKITSGGSLSGEYNVKQFKEDMLKNNTNLIELISSMQDLAFYVLSLYSVISVSVTTAFLTFPIIAFKTIIDDKNSSEQPTINIFKQLHKSQ